MTKTVEEMVSELDARFEGFSDFYNKIEDSHKYLTKIFADYTFTVIQRFGRYFEISFEENKSRQYRVFVGVTKGEAIRKAHDYFIVKGGVL